MNALKAEDAYRLWAPTYSEETAISFLDEELAAALTPPLRGRLLLDAGCGTGRRLKRADTASAIGIDLSCEMLMEGAARNVAVADLRALPFPPQSFDVIWCRLVLGHLRDPRPAYQELARVCRVGGAIFVSDFHAEAVAAGHRRTFRDFGGREWVVEHHVHDIASHTAMAANARLALREKRNGVIGPAVESFYARAGRARSYQRDRGLPVVAAFLFERIR